MRNAHVKIAALASAVLMLMAGCQTGAGSQEQDNTHAQSQNQDQALSQADKGSQIASPEPQTEGNSESTGKMLTFGSMGNTVGNLVNGGTIAESDGTLYYRSTADGKLYARSSDGGEATLLVDYPNIFSINVSDGWIYYQQEPDQGLYRIRTDGTGKEELVDEYCQHVCVSNGYIFYKDESDMSIHRIGLDGSDDQTICEDRADSICVAGEYIFYNEEYDASSQLYRINTDGTGRERVFGERCFCANADENYIYVIRKTDETVCRIYPDGSNTELLEGIVAKTINVSGGWIYYANVIDGNKLYKARIDGTDVTLICDMPVTQISVIGDWVYFDHYRINKDGTRLSEFQRGLSDTITNERGKQHENLCHLCVSDPCAAIDSLRAC